MLQCQCVKIPVREGSAPKLRAWIAGLGEREGEVLEALEAEGIHDEAVFLSSEPSGEYLYLYSRAADLAAAGAAFQQSTLAVDVEFKQLMQECLDLEGATLLRLLFAADSATGDVRAPTG